MEQSSAPTAVNAGMQEFERTTSRWGRLTMIAGLIISLAGPIYLLMSGSIQFEQSQLWGAFLAVAGTFFLIWIIEPITYFPILGPASMYQAFMIGNISNKLLPAAMIAQAKIDAKPGTSRGSLAAVMAISGAASVHLVSLLLFVGFLGTWLLSVVPAEVITVVRLYVFPAVIGAVIVQAIFALRQYRPTIIAFAVALVVQFGLVPLFPKLSMATTAICVILTILVAWFARKRA